MFQARGRQISVGECKFVFERIWNVTCDHEMEGVHDGDHVHGQRSKLEVMLSDLFHVVEHSGILLNKENPPDDSTVAFDEFQKYMQSETIEIENKQTEIYFVHADDMPKVIFAIFVGQKDQVRIDAA